MQIVEAVTAEHIAQVRELFEEYWASFGFTPCFQNFGAELAGLFPGPNDPALGPNAFLSDPKGTETENKFDIRYDYTIGSKDNFFARFSYGNDSTFLPSPMQMFQS